MRSGLRRSRMHDARRAASPSFLSTPRSNKHAGVRRQLAAIEPNAHLLARNRWKIKRQ